MSQWSGLYNTTGKTQRATGSESSRSKSGSEAWADSVTGISAMLQPLSAAELERYAKVTPTAAFKCFMDAGNDITESDRWVDASNKEYEIVGIMDVAGMGEVDKLLLSRPVED